MKADPPREYRSPLRSVQADLTQQRIVQAAVELVADGVDVLTVARIATKAQVAVRTVARCFPTRDVLHDAIWNALNAQIGEMPRLDSVAELQAFVPELFRRYASVEGQIRAVTQSTMLQGARLRQSSIRAKALRRVIDASVTGSDERLNRNVRAAAYLLTTPIAMLNLKEIYGLSTDDAGATAAWSIGVLLREHAKRSGQKTSSSSKSRKTRT